MTDDACFEFLNDTPIPTILDNDQFVGDLVGMRIKVMLKHPIDGAVNGPMTVCRQRPITCPTTD
ncbi:hypothetical protein [Magnetospirillum sp. ME-1]|uniref:hypothetical protein n=1 Tax=Magnetospirillum sp. ME-1 TaxID=1639348 RepID=UPI0011AE9266|nr:hypothetical protein [Magnetospirillum sp. ME-1]